MSWRKRPHAATSARGLHGRGLVVLSCATGLLAVCLTLAAFLEPQEVQTLAAIIRRPASPTLSNWTRFGFSASGTRDNAVETHINATSVARLHVVWRTHVPSVADSTPAYLHGLPFPDGSVRNVLYLTTKTGSLIALDADSGALLWSRSNPTYDPNKMTTSSPYADASTRMVYSYGMDGRVHKYDAITGKEVRQGGWPKVVTTMRNSEKESSALNAANGFLYVAMASFGGDAPPYQGHVVAINLATGASHVFNTICSDHTHLLGPQECRDNGAGIWARPGVVVDPQTGDIIFATGNGPYTADARGHDWGDSVLVVSRDGTRLIDAYTPRKPNDLYTQDLDLGSSDPALLPAIPASSIPYLAVQTGKEGVVRLLNLRNLSGQGGPGHVGGELQTLDAPNHCPVLTQPAVWTDAATGGVWVVVSSECAIGGYQVAVSANRRPMLRLRWTVPLGATSPIVAGGVVFAATTGNKEILALDPRSGHLLWTSSARRGGSIGYTHWENPIVVNGRLYCSDEDGNVTAYGL